MKDFKMKSIFHHSLRAFIEADKAICSERWKSNFNSTKYVTYQSPSIWFSFKEFLFLYISLILNVTITDYFYENSNLQKQCDN